MRPSAIAASPRDACALTRLRPHVVVEDGAHLPRRVAHGCRGFGLPRDGRVQVPLQHAAEGSPLRRGSARRRGLDERTRLRGLDRQRCGERPVVVVEPAPRRVLARDLGTHHPGLGARQERDEQRCLARMQGARVHGKRSAAERRGGPAAGRVRQRRDVERDAVAQQCHRIRPVAHERRIAPLERSPRLLFLKARDACIERRELREQRCGGDPGAAVDDDAALGIEHGAAQTAEHLEEGAHGAAQTAEHLEEGAHEAFVASTLPGKAAALGLVEEGLERRGRMGHAVGAPIEHADVDEPGQGEQRAVQLVRCAHAGEEPLDVDVLGERRQEAGARELGDPHDVELQHVGRGDASGQPLHVELMAEVGGVGRAAHLDVDVWMRGLEALDERREGATFLAERRRTDDELHGVVRPRGGRDEDREAKGEGGEHRGVVVRARASTQPCVRPAAHDVRATMQCAAAVVLVVEPQWRLSRCATIRDIGSGIRRGVDRACCDVTGHARIDLELPFVESRIRWIHRRRARLGRLWPREDRAGQGPRRRQLEGRDDLSRRAARRSTQAPTPAARGFRLSGRPK
jgi:hypothetical protein